MGTAAITHAFDLNNEEFSRVLTMPAGRRRRDLLDLGRLARNRRLCLHEAIYDALSAMNDHLSREEKWAPKEHFEPTLNDLIGSDRDRALRELRLYRLAVACVPWRQGSRVSTLGGGLAFLDGAVAAGDPWGTFMAFSMKWEELGEIQMKELERHLPEIWKAK